MMIPESVAAYLQDGGTRRAINELRGVGGAALLDGLEWPELPRFYRALQAARQFETEWAILGCAVWDATWSGLLDGWYPLSPEEQVDGEYDASLTIDGLLDTLDQSLWFGRVFTARGWTLYAAVAGIPGQGFVLKVSCDTEFRSHKFPSVCDRSDELGNWVSPPVEIRDGQIDIHELRSIASEAVASLPKVLRTALPGFAPDGR